MELTLAENPKKRETTKVSTAKVSDLKVHLILAWQLDHYPLSYPKSISHETKDNSNSLSNSPSNYNNCQCARLIVTYSNL